MSNNETLIMDGDTARSRSDSTWSPDELRSAANWVMNRADHVRIDTTRVDELVERLDRLDGIPWIHASPVRFDDLDLEDHLMVVLVFNAISFCYWPAPWWDNNMYEGDVRRGSWALLASIRHAVDRNVPLLAANYLQALGRDDLALLLNGRGRLASIDRRAAILREVGTALERDFDGCFARLVSEEPRDASELVGSILRYFPSFRDETQFEGCTIPFAKRAQLLAADCHRVLEQKAGRGLNGFESLTACADYMLPAFLASEGVLAYSSELREVIGRQVPLPAGGRHEVEIRAATIVACDRLAAVWGKLPMEVNDALWIEAGKLFATTPTHHRTWTEAY